MFLGDSLSMSRDNIYGDYYRIILIPSGNYSELRLNITTNSLFKTTSAPIIITYSNSLNVYTLPVDFPLTYSNLLYFHTKGNYNSIKVTDANLLLKNANTPQLFAKTLYQSWIIMFM